MPVIARTVRDLPGMLNSGVEAAFFNFVKKMRGLKPTGVLGAPYSIHLLPFLTVRFGLFFAFGPGLRRFSTQPENCRNQRNGRRDHRGPVTSRSRCRVKVACPLYPFIAMVLTSETDAVRRFGKASKLHACTRSLGQTDPPSISALALPTCSLQLWPVTLGCTDGKVAVLC